MKKILILSIFAILLTACTNVQLEAEPQPIIETVTVTEYVEVANTQKIEELQAEIEKYKKLIGNLEWLFRYVYFVYGDNGNIGIEGTGFTLIYKDNCYLITAGHAVKSEYGYFPNLGFKNSKGNWFYPKLLKYENDTDNSRDYAIFYSDKVFMGFEPDLDDDESLFMINNTISNYVGRSIVKSVKSGDSGSPIIDLDCEVTKITNTELAGYDTNINIVLEVIDSLK